MTHPSVDSYLAKEARWRGELSLLREVLLSCGLVEAFKWRQPCYTHAGANLVILGSFKDSCVVSFLKGSLLSDPLALLEKPGEHTQQGRVIRFKNRESVVAALDAVRRMALEAMEAEASGRSADDAADTAEIPMPEELTLCFKGDDAFRAAFASLTPGRRRAYLMHFTAAAQSATRSARIDRFRGRILEGKGLNDCVCGLSRRMPRCDGSHARSR